MRVVFDKDILRDALESSCSIFASKNTFTVLSNVLIKVKDNSCTIVSTDLSDTMHLKCALVSGDDCEFLLSGKTILSLLKTLPKGEVSFDINEDVSQAILRSGKFKANVTLVSRTEFPNTTDVTKKKAGLKFKFVELKNAFSYVLPFASTDLNRDMFCGVNLNYEFKENKEALITLCATDGHRLAKTEVIAQDSNAGDPVENGIIISSKAVQIFSKFFSEEEEVMLLLEDKKTKLVFKSDTVCLTTTLIQGTFPNFYCVIPNTTKHIIVNRIDLINCLKRCPLFNPKIPSARLDLKENNINVNCTGTDVGSMSEDIECKYNSEEISLTVNAKYLEQSLAMVDDNMAVIGVVDKDSPIKVVSLADYEANDEGTMSIVMPMQM